MSGHSHFSTIKHKKAITDAKKSKIFSKLTREIIIAAKEKGGNLEINSGLRFAVEKAKKWNLPKENIERAIKKGTGEIEDIKLESFLFEAYGPGNIAFIIEGITDNKNRSIGEIKKVLSANEGKLAGEGSVKWLFKRKGTIVVDPNEQDENFKNKENLELAGIEAGADDICWQNDVLNIYTEPEKLENVRKNLEDKKIQIESVSLDWLAKEEIETDGKAKKSCQKLFEDLDELDSVQEIYSNLKFN